MMSRVSFFSDFTRRSMMKNVILLLVVTGIGLVAGADMRSAAIAFANAAHKFSPAASRATRQDFEPSLHFTVVTRVTLHHLGANAKIRKIRRV